ncbi:MAG: hypothetical protein KAQ85_10760 [Thermodesulfovibrionia bacterium]|nr:hypothetical protein [Thermodesulfovibrionia bacterium]
MEKSKRTTLEVWKSMTREQRIEVRKFITHILINAFIFSAIGTFIVGAIDNWLGLFDDMPIILDIVIFVIVVMSTCCLLYAKEIRYKYPGRVYFIVLISLTVIFTVGFVVVTYYQKIM